MPGQNVGGSQGDANASMMTPGLSQLLAPLLMLFGESPEEQQQNLSALSEEMKGQAQTTKAKSMYSPELFMRFAQAQQARQAAQMRVPRGFTPAMAASLLRTIQGAY